MLQKRLLGVTARAWFEKLADTLGEITETKHQRGRTKPPSHHRALRNTRKAQRQARKAQRGKR